MGCHFKYYMIFFQKGILTKHFKCLFSKVPRIKKKYQTNSNPISFSHIGFTQISFYCHIYSLFVNI